MGTRTTARAGGGFFRRLWRALRQVFHESTGALFLFLALFWSAAGLRQWMRGSAAWTWLAPGLFALLMASFSLTSFLAARRVR
jgi:hypothetical protein